MSGSAFENLCAAIPPHGQPFIAHFDEAPRLLKQGCTVRPVNENERQAYIDHLQYMQREIERMGGSTE